MFRRILPLALSAFAVVGLSSIGRAQQCPDICPVNFQSSSSGFFLAPDIVTVVPTSVTNATSALLGVIGGGFVCNTCTPCAVRVTVSWNIVNNRCVSYNNCGLLQNGPGSGSIGGVLTRNCNEAGLNFRVDYGTCNI